MARTLELLSFGVLSLSLIILADGVAAATCANGACAHGLEDETALLQHSVLVKSPAEPHRPIRTTDNEHSHQESDLESEASRSNETYAVPGHTLPSTAWCGPGQDPTAEHPGQPEADNWCVNKYPADWACRRHDACAVATLRGGVPQVSCQCDNDLYQAAQAVSGSWAAKFAVSTAYNPDGGLFSLACVSDFKDEPRCKTPRTDCIKELMKSKMGFAKDNCWAALPDDCWIYKEGPNRFMSGPNDELAYRNFGYKTVFCKDKECTFPDGTTMNQKDMLNSQTSWPACKPNPKTSYD